LLLSTATEAAAEAATSTLRQSIHQLEHQSPIESDEPKTRAFVAVNQFPWRVAKEFYEN